MHCTLHNFTHFFSSAEFQIRYLPVCVIVTYSIATYITVTYIVITNRNICMAYYFVLQIRSIDIALVMTKLQLPNSGEKVCQP